MARNWRACCSHAPALNDSQRKNRHISGKNLHPSAISAPRGWRGQGTSRHCHMDQKIYFGPHPCPAPLIAIHRFPHLLDILSLNIWAPPNSQFATKMLIFLILYAGSKIQNSLRFTATLYNIKEIDFFLFCVIDLSSRNVRRNIFAAIAIPSSTHQNEWYLI